jgi:neutral amino acid transport system ATP-binding protein
MESGGFMEVYLRTDGLKKSFGGVKAIDGCSFGIKRGMITALVGPNGSGKTTIFGIISGIQKADRGDVFFKNRRITNLEPNVISNLGISRLFQESRLFRNLTVEENLLLAFDNTDVLFWKNLLVPARNAKDRCNKVREMLKLVGMEEYENVQTKNLSYGQKRLIELLRAVIKPHALLMLDEPVAGITPRIRRVISGLLMDLREQGDTIFIIEHDMEFTFGIADRILVINKGKIIADGKPGRVKKDRRVIEAYIGE